MIFFRSNTMKCVTHHNIPNKIANRYSVYELYIVLFIAFILHFDYTGIICLG